MNFDDAIKAHSSWKMKLSQYLKSPDHSLKASDIQPDNLCELGRWIYGEGKKFSTEADFTALRDAHAHFHKCAADVVRRADSGQNVSEEITLGAKSEFSQASNAVVQAIMNLRRKIGV